MIENENFSLSMVSLPDLSFTVADTIPLECWQNTICLSKIWIPNHLLTNRRKPTRETKGVFHTLEPRGQARKMESFSVYYSDSDSETDLIFESDSDSVSSEKIKKDDSVKNAEKIENSSELKSYPSISNSLNDILDKNLDIDMTHFPLKKEHQHKEQSLHDILDKNLDIDMTYFPLKKEHQHKEQSLHDILDKNLDIDMTHFPFKNEHQHKEQSKKTSKKKKNKSLTLDKFLENYTEEDKQESCANDYLRRVLLSKNYPDEKMKLKNNSEFPTLHNDIQFMHSKEKAPLTSATEIMNYGKQAPTDITIKTTIADIFSVKKKEVDVCQAEMAEPTPESFVGKIVIENIPSEISQDDVLQLLCGYGEVKFLTPLQPDGAFLKVAVEIDAICDIDWIIECLNGTEPFGASSRVLKCYKQSLD